MRFPNCRPRPVATMIVMLLTIFPTISNAFTPFDSALTATTTSPSTSSASTLVGTHPLEVYNDPNYTGSWCYSNQAETANIYTTCNDQISSIFLQTGWSIRLFRDPNQGGPSICLNRSDTDLSNNSYEDGSSLNNSISSFMLSSQAWCAGSPTPAYPLEVYNDPNYTGSWCYSTTSETANIAPSCNDQITSILLRSGWSVRVYRDPNQSGPSKCFTASDPDLTNDTFDDSSPINDSISSFKLYNQANCPDITPPPPPPPPPTYAFQVYNDPNYSGTWCYSVDAETANIYVTCNDRISSVVLKSGWSVRVYRDPNQGGPSRCLANTDPDLSNDMFDDGSPVNDSISSFILFQASNCTITPPTSTYPFEVYTEANYTGSRCYSVQAEAANIAGLCNDQISSILIKSGWSVRVYREQGQSGPSKCLTTNDADLSNDTFDDGTPLNNTISSFILYQQASCPVTAQPSNYPFTVYSDANYVGTRCYSVQAQAANIHPTCNEQISSIALRYGWSVRIYRDLNQKGSSKCLTGSDADLGNDTFDDGARINDAISSFVLYQQTTCPSTSQPPVTPIPTITITHIEVTQATQDAANQVPLIARKPTLVRVYIDCGATCTQVSGVTGALEVSNTLAGLSMAPTPRTVTAFHADWTSQRGDLSKTLNFLVPVQLLSGNVTFTAIVNGVRKSETLAFNQAKTLRIVYVPLRYNGKEPDSTLIRNAYRYAEQLYPTARIEYTALPSIEWNPCFLVFCNYNPKPLLNFLTKTYEKTYADAPFGNKPDFIVGWLPSSAFTDYPDNYADTSYGGGKGKAAFVVEGLGFNERKLAHEVGHLLGRRHTNTLANIYDTQCYTNQGRTDIDPNSGWHYPNSKIQEFGVQLSSISGPMSPNIRIKNPNTTYDYMSYCGFGGNDWTSHWTYQAIYSERLRSQGLTQQSALAELPQTYMLVSGQVTADMDANFQPMWVISSNEPLDNPPSGTSYCLETQDNTGTTIVSHCFDLSFQNYETGEVMSDDNFNVALPYSPQVARIVLKKADRTLAVQVVSTNTPSMTVISPNGGETLLANDTVEVTWRASDLDGDTLLYSILYSPDGVHWVPVGTDVTETHLSVNVSELAGGANARFRVIATDGVNTVSDDSDGPVNVEGKAPDALIEMPGESLTIAPGTLLLLEGDGYDLEDGAMNEAALRWSSDRDGELGSGSQVLADLTPGQHVITLSATDTQGKTTTDTINVFVANRTYLPLTQP